MLRRSYSDNTNAMRNKIATDGLKTWLDLAGMVATYPQEKFIKSYPKELLPLKGLLDRYHPAWELGLKVMPEDLNRPLPLFIINAIRVITQTYLAQPLFWVNKDVSLRHCIMMTIHNAVNQNVQQKYVPDFQYYKSGLNVQSYDLLEDIKYVFLSSYKKDSALFNSYILEAIFACQYICTHLNDLKNAHDLVTMRTPRAFEGIELDNVPFHAEEHSSKISRRSALVNIVNTVVGAYCYYQSQNMLPEFFDLLYGGNCIEGRTRSLFEDFSRRQCQSDFLHFEKEMQASALPVVHYLASMGLQADMAAITQQLFVMYKNKQFYAGSAYLPEDSRLTDIAPVTRYWDEALQYMPSMVICNPAGFHGDINSSVTKLQAQVLGCLARKRYGFETEYYNKQVLVAETINVEVTRPETYIKYEKHRRLVEREVDVPVADESYSFWSAVGSYFFDMGSQVEKKRVTCEEEVLVPQKGVRYVTSIEERQITRLVSQPAERRFFTDRRSGPQAALDDVRKNQEGFVMVGAY